MRILISLGTLVAGVVLLILGFSSSRSVAPGGNETFIGATGAQTILLIGIGALCLLYGGVSTIFNRK